MFLDDCKTWKRKPGADKTWANFKTYFSLAHCEFRETRTTTAGGGFASANSADIHSYYHPNDAYQQETVDAIANIASANATAYDHEYVYTLNATVVTLTTELAATNAKLIKALVETTKLTATVGELCHTTNKTRGGGRHYCWSCGYIYSRISWE